MNFNFTNHRLSSIGIFVLINIMLVSSFRHLTRPFLFAKTVRSLSMGVKNMTPFDFGTILKDPEVRQQYQIIDVREPDELAIAKIAGDDILNLPLSQASSWTAKIAEGQLLDASKPTVCLCHHGGRSQRVALYLDGEAKFETVYNMVGGINVFARVVDPSIPTY